MDKFRRLVNENLRMFKDRYLSMIRNKIQKTSTPGYIVERIEEIENFEIFGIEDWFPIYFSTCDNSY